MRHTWIVVGALVVAASSHGEVNRNYRGAESFLPTGAAPNITRCGAFPAFIELSFSGSGIDSEGGSFLVTTSGCLEQSTGRVFDLRATDTYLASGDQVFIEAADFYMVPDPTTCAAVSKHAIGFRVAGGTGGHAGAQGRGTFHFASTDAQCAGRVEPTYVWFEGAIDVP